MRLLSSVFLLCVALYSLLGAADVNAQDPHRGIAGRPAPSWTVSRWHQLPAGKTQMDVKDLKGKVVYLYFFQSWCPGCHQIGFPTLQELTRQYAGDEDVEFVAIQTTFEGHRINTADKLPEMSERYQLSIPFGQSAGSTGTPPLMKDYRTGGTPWVVMIDRRGRVRYNDFHVSVSQGRQIIESLKRE